MTALADSTSLYVPRAEYDELKARYEELLGSAPAKAETGNKKRKLRASKAAPSTSVEPDGEEGDGRSGRKRRSIKLEVGLS